MTTFQIIGLVVLGLVLMGSVVSKLVLQGIKRPLENRIADQYEANGVLMKDLKANSFGLA